MALTKDDVHSYDEFGSMPIFGDVSDSSGRLTEEQLLRRQKLAFKLLRGLHDHGFQKPSPIQARAIVPLANGCDTIAQAQSGTGKTGTFTTGILSNITRDWEADQKPYVQAIVIAHTYELAKQIREVFLSIGNRLKINVCLCIGKTSVPENIRDLSRAHIAVGTPGRLADLVDRNAFRLSSVKMIVLDEADKLLSGKFLPQIGSIMESIDHKRTEAGKRLQVGIFSATLPSDVVELARTITEDPVVIQVPIEELTLKGIRQYKVMACDDRDESVTPYKFKASLIAGIHNVKTIPQCIIYVNNARSAENLHNDLYEIYSMETSVIHGNKSTHERASIIKDFRNGRSRILISTDLLARGFDAQHVMLVINFDLPRVLRKKFNKEDERIEMVIDEQRMSEYVHRIGRSGRYGRKGVAINLVVTNTEKTYLEEIERYYNAPNEDLPRDLEDIF